MPRTFIDHLNHEIRSPLTVVVGMAELLSLSSLTAEQRQHLGVLRQAADSILRLMDLAVDFSRLRARALTLKDESFSLQGVLDQLRKPDPGRGRAAPLEIDLRPDVPDRLQGDAARLRQALGELAAYLADVRRADRIVVRVGAERSTTRDLRLVFAFASAERPFPAVAAEDERGGQWVACSEETVAKRHGLELAVAAGLAHAMNGNLWIATEAAADVAAALTVEFGIPHDSERFEEILEEASSAKPRSEKRILLAEDIESNRQIIASLLKRRGHAVSIAADGAQAVEAFQREAGRFDVVILDLEMPVMDGWQAAKEIRRLAAERPAAERPTAERPIRIVALTAHRVEGCADLLERGLFDAAVGKPVAAERLFEALEADGPRSSLAASSSQATPGAPAEPPGIDYSGALSRLCGDERLLDDLVQFFLDDSPELLCEARAAIERSDAKALERTAHSIRGLASNFGAQSTVNAAAVLEEIGRRSDLEAADGACRTLEAEVVRLTAILEDRVKTAGAAGLGDRKS